MLKLPMLLGQYKPEQVFVMNTVIATKFASEYKDEENTNYNGLLYALNEVVIVDLDTIRLMIRNVINSKRKILEITNDSRKHSTTMEFLGLDSNIIPMLMIDDSYLEYMKELSSELDSFILSQRD